MSEAIANADDRELYRLWQAFGDQMTWRGVIDKGGDREVAERALAELPGVTALEALEANRRLVELLTGQRWYVMRAAREAGATWEQVGAAMGMTKQGAQDWYRRKITDQERYAGQWHDAERARAAL
jgi:hypothetical protein